MRIEWAVCYLSCGIHAVSCTRYNACFINFHFLFTYIILMFDLQTNHCGELEDFFLIPGPEGRKDVFAFVMGRRSFFKSSKTFLINTVHSKLHSMGLCCYATHGQPEYDYYRALDDSMPIFSTWKSGKPTQLMEQVRAELKHECDTCKCLFNSSLPMSFAKKEEVN